MAAYLINHPNNNKFTCNICSELIPNDKIIGLKCNVKKHIFCYDCINDWYIITKKNMNHNLNSNYNFVRMCPICRKNGGYLPNLNDNYIKEVHYKDKENIIQTCGYKLKTKDDYCMNIGKQCFNNLCKKHFNIEEKKNKKCIKVSRKNINEEINNGIENGIDNEINNITIKLKNSVINICN